MASLVMGFSARTGFINVAKEGAGGREGKSMSHSEISSGKLKNIGIGER